MASEAAQNIQNPEMITTTDPVQASGTLGVMPEFVRPKEAVRLFGLSLRTVTQLVSEGRIKSHLVRLTGNKSGMRLISTASLREFIEKH